MKRQALNPFLPLDEYIPDGEPHVFGDRLYLFGSHDTEGGTRYCSEGNYLCYSAPLDDLSDWRCEGEIFHVSQNPHCVPGEKNDLYAPDVVRGNDGRYYLYYIIDGKTPATGHNMIHVAVCDTPAGRYEHYGFVRNADGSPYRKYLDGDPAVINDDGVIRLYHGWSLSMVAAGANRAGAGEEEKRKFQEQEASRPAMPEPGSPAMKEALKPVYRMLFERSGGEVDALEEPLMGANTVVLQDDMLTVEGEPRRIVPGQFDTPGDCSFYGHAFYEAASIRKIGGLYYFIYSSENSQELCYATSRYPDREFVYGGTIISNGDVGYRGRKAEDRLNMTANNHGSLECVNGQWYIFYHRQTHNSTYSRQACAEPVRIGEDGRIAQVECTSCGLNGGPLAPEGAYPAPYACNITNGHMPHATNTVVNADIPYITHGDAERYITNIKDGTRIVFKYFALDGEYLVTLRTRGEGQGAYVISAQEKDGDCGSAASGAEAEGTSVSGKKAENEQAFGPDREGCPKGEETTARAAVEPSQDWQETAVRISGHGTKALCLRYESETPEEGEQKATQLLSVAFARA
ncbi:MAG: family 43 glycosylhydrolase [Eubacteriales bacterium]|nr:family 43 glycosylhydrolase [Eubacteriales bacterium]